MRSSRITIPLLALVAVTSTWLLMIRACRYFPESTFELSPDSRLPKWIVLPSGLTRSDVELSMNYYTMPSEPDAVFTLRKHQGSAIQEFEGKECSTYPADSTKYPAFIAISVNGVTDVIEHKKMEPVFYITDDPVALAKLGTKGC